MLRSRALVRVLLPALAAASAVVATAAPAQAAPPPDPYVFPAAIDPLPPKAPFECTDVVRPGTYAFAELLRKNYGVGYGELTRACDAAYGSKTSDHKAGRAVDWSVDYANAAHRRYAAEVITWLKATDRYGNRAAAARRLGVRQLIWDDRVHDITNSTITSCEGGTRCGNSTHRDHIHFSLSSAGSEKQTSWWRPGPMAGTDTAGAVVAGSDDLLLWRLTDDNTSSAIRDVKFGRPSKKDLAMPGDWDGDGDSAPGVARPLADGQLGWTLGTDTGGTAATFTWGRTSKKDVPLVGDWNGDGKDTVGVARPNSTTGQYDVLLTNNNASSGAVPTFRFGRTATDRVVVGDWNGDGKDTVGVVRDGTDGLLLWRLAATNATTTALQDVHYGRPGDRTVVGDWNGDGKDTVGIARPDAASGLMLWRTTNSSTANPTVGQDFTYGRPAYQLVTGDWNNR